MKAQQQSHINKLIGLVLTLVASLVQAEETYQERVLFNPSQSNLAAEARGRVMIYDGFKEEDVDRALDTQFDRIENMMFINTQRQQDDGEYVSDDDC